MAYAHVHAPTYPGGLPPPSVPIPPAPHSMPSPGGTGVTWPPGAVGQMTYGPYAPPDQHIQSRRQQISPGLLASGPMVCTTARTQYSPVPGSFVPVSPGPVYYPLPMQEARVTVECHIATALVKIEFLVDGSRSFGGAGVLFLPKNHDTTVTEVTIENTTRDSVFATLVVPKDEAKRYAKSPNNKPIDPRPAGPNNPELFSISFGSISTGDVFKVTVHCFQPLWFQEGMYQLQFPMVWPRQVVSGPGSLQSMMQINCSINTGIPTEVTWECPTHKMLEHNVQPGRVELVADREVQWGNKDFMIGYHVWGNAIVASVNIQPPNADRATSDPRGTFSLAISPPAPGVTQPFMKSVVFLVDRSRTMVRPRIDYVRNALMEGLDMLSPVDHFNIIAYDHEQITLSAELMKATPENIATAKNWIIGHVVERGGMDILTPILQALQILQDTMYMPYVFLLTAGAVENERDIAQYLQRAVQHAEASNRRIPRVSTFAIGHNCNHYFLKQLAVIGRGTFDVASGPFDIQVQIRQMFEAASRPVLTNVRIRMEGLSEVEVYPYPIPDLFVGLPLSVCGKYSGAFPGEIQILGDLPNGDEWCQDVHTTQAAAMSLDKVFIKQRLDVLSALAWFNDDAEIVKQIINESMRHSVVTQHTAMMVLESTKSKHQEMVKEKAQGKKFNPKKFAVGGAAGLVAIVGATSILSGNPVPPLPGECCGDCWGDIGDCVKSCTQETGECMSDVGKACNNFMECLSNCCF
ncbi:unnamed protein product [Ostreobium quekettii]|uniref:VWFA domain-containing protein n=1 Tax=Ostreobium quekettii TaxID=121088 RepID=A0A8S1IU03_9CHLO|nr:unnamed protein product [Ostreobium quekettii]|eukprot:evm.model.scf_1080.2 EVM.evm.TU.scf_1080.2   scf_1080:8731-18546(-)